MIMGSLTVGGRGERDSLDASTDHISDDCQDGGTVSKPSIELKSKLMPSVITNRSTEQSETAARPRLAGHRYVA